MILRKIKQKEIERSGKCPNLGKYAYFLHYKTKNYKKAEEYYQRAIEANPRRANTLGDR